MTLNADGFRFGPEATHPLLLTLADDYLRDSDGTAFCTPEELRDAPQVGPVLQVGTYGGPLYFAAWIDVRRIHKPDVFRRVHGLPIRVSAGEPRG